MHTIKKILYVVISSYLQIEKLNNLQKEIKDIEDNLAQAKKGTCIFFYSFC